MRLTDFWNVDTTLMTCKNSWATAACLHGAAVIAACPSRTCRRCMAFWRFRCLTLPCARQSHADTAWTDPVPVAYAAATALRCAGFFLSTVLFCAALQAVRPCLLPPGALPALSLRSESLQALARWTVSYFCCVWSTSDILKQLSTCRVHTYAVSSTHPMAVALVACRSASLHILYYMP